MGEFYATFQFHGLALGVSADQACAPHAAELERFWSAFQCGPTNRRDIAISLSEPPDWRPFAELETARQDAFFDDTKVSVRADRYQIWTAGVIAVGTRNRIDIFCRDAKRTDVKYVARFLINLAFTETLRRQGLYYVHAACVQSPTGRTYLISGDAGHGKTTVTLGLLQQGYRYLSDDAVFLDTRGPELRILGYHKSFHVAQGAGTNVVAPLAGQAQAKFDLDPEKAFPGKRLRSVAKIDYILLPEITGERATRLQPVGRTELLTAFFRTSTSVFFEPSLAGGHLAALQKVVTQAEGYRLKAGKDVIANPKRYHELFEELPCAA